MTAANERTYSDSPKIEFAGVESGLKIVVGERAAINTIKNAWALTKPQVHSLHGQLAAQFAKLKKCAERDLVF